MAKYKTIAVIYGSDTSEWEVSCRSGEFTASRIDDAVYDVYEVFARFGKWSLVAYRRRNSMRVPLPEGSRPEVDKSDFSVTVLGEKVKFDFAFVMQHGAPGETGQLQGYLEMLKVPYSSCSSFVSAISFDKFACKSYLRCVDFVKFAPDALVRRTDDIEAKASEIAASIGVPLFVKPTDSGSSFGISQVKDAAGLADAIRFAFSESSTVIVEKAIKGREFTCAAYFDGAAVTALPVIEIVPHNEYFDYDAKYNGDSEEVCPAQIPERQMLHIQDVTKRIYAHMACSGLVRMDYIYADDGLYFLEINTIPGMTSASLVPRMVRAAGMDMTAFLSTIIENA